MTERCSELDYRRPAPFPVYAHNPIPGLAACARRVFALLVAATLLSPFTLDTGSADSGAVQLLRLELGAREPVLLSCDFSLAEFTAVPPQLGTLMPDCQFLCSGQVERGVLYGTISGSRRVILITYDDTTPSIERLLNDVRSRVDTMNRRRNLLRQAETEVRVVPDDPADVPLWYWNPGSAAIPAGGFAALALALEDDAVPLGEFCAQAAGRAWDIAQLKTLYYSAQDARIDMLAAQFNLQLVLASAPVPDVGGQLSLGGSAAAQAGMQGELSRLMAAWNERLIQLEAQALRDRSWLHAQQDPRPASEWEVFSFMPDLGSMGAEFRLTPVGAPSTTVLELERGFREARLVISDAETTAIRASLDRLGALTQTVAMGQPLQIATREVAVAAAGFSQPELTELPGYSAVEEAVARGEALVFYSQLAQEFAGIAPGPGHRPTAESIPEVLYCLAAAELVEVQERNLEEVPQATAVPDPAQHRPRDMQLYDSFIKFARWLSAGSTTPPAE